MYSGCLRTFAVVIFVPEIIEKQRMGLKTVEPERTPEPLGIAKTNGETVATTSNYRNLSIHLHTEEATGSIPVSPPSFQGLVRQRPPTTLTLWSIVSHGASRRSQKTPPASSRIPSALVGNKMGRLMRRPSGHGVVFSDCDRRKYSRVHLR